MSDRDSAGDTPTPRMPAWRRYLRFRGTDVRADVQDELEFHIDMIASRHVAAGMAPRDARERARKEFGDMETARRECENIGANRERRHEWVELADSVRKDVRIALRGLRRAPGLTAAIVLTLALGIGASTAIFSIVRGVLLRPLPYASPDRLVRIWEVSPRGDDHNVVSVGNYADWRRRAKSFASFGAHMAPYGVSLVGDAEPARVTTADVTVSVFQVLGVQAALGRVLVADDERDHARVTVLSHAFWSTRFGQDPSVIGRQLTIGDVPHTVVGVMPPSFEFPSAGVDFWRPVSANVLTSDERRSHNWLVIARLAPGATLAGARAEVSGIAGALAREYPEFMTGFGANVVGMQADIVATVRPLLLVLLAGAALLLAVACANIANLLLARGLGRRREMAVREALGAGRGRLIRQLMTESLVLAGVGGGAGIAVASVLTRGLLALAPIDIPRLSAVRVDAGVLAFAVAASVVSGVFFGLVPALRVLTRRSAAPSLQSMLRSTGDRGGSARQGVARSMLLVGELAVSLVLLTGAGLLLRSAYRLSVIDYGYRPDGLVAGSIDLPRTRYDSSAKHVMFYEQLMEHVRQLPHVTGVAATNEDLGSTSSMTFSFAVDGRPSRTASGREEPQSLRVVAGDYFKVMGIPIRRGRAFAATDRADSPPVVVVNESLARLYWPGANPVGSRISFVGAAGPWLEIVGVVGDTRSNAADQAPAPAVYMPFAQKRWTWMSWLTLIVRTDGDADVSSLSGEIRSSVWQLDSRLPIHGIATVGAMYRESVARRRFATALAGAFAAAALALGMIGMYGVLSYGVLQRRREFGIRIALGAQASQVTRAVVSEALTLAVVAVVIGSAAAFALTRLLSSLLFEVSPRDPVTFVGVAVVVGAVSAIAAWVPARRATRIDPASTIRES
ncbi:MAG TPA: ABC transporter permease [Gemmatimonadaceae bacterium]|nr:ABC transporter permease [Gemmatimonadaceae bacterium]